MGMLLPFIPKATRNAPPTNASAGSAKLLLFTGVRYERHAGPEHDKPLCKTMQRRKG